jgi:choline-sulfatase
MKSSYDRRQFLKQSALTLGLLPLALQKSAPGQSSDRPNFLFLFADDYRAEAIHALGCEAVYTPNIDRLVRQGTTFTNCYNQGGWHGAICMASRAMLITARHLWNAHLLDDRVPELAEAQQLWPQEMQAAGYSTFMSGKWHVNCNPAKVFQHVRHVRPGMPPDIESQYLRPEENTPDPFDPADTTQGGYYTGGKHWSEVVADDGVEFLRKRTKNEDPFFMYLSFNAPHDPRQSSRYWLDRYDAETIPLPDNFMTAYPWQKEIGCSPDMRDERLAPFPRTARAIRTHLREYYAIISHLDAQIGRILDALQRSGRAENTYIIFSGDNGLSLGSHGFMGKQNLYEHSMKVPLLFTGPGIPSDQRQEGLVYMQDLVPTVLELAGVTPQSPTDYQSLVPLLRGDSAAVRSQIYGAYMMLQRMVRNERYKLIHYPTIQRHRLYDLQQDPQELKDLSDDPRHASLLKEMQQELRRLQEEMRDPVLDSA